MTLSAPTPKKFVSTVDRRYALHANNAVPAAFRTNRVQSKNTMTVFKTGCWTQA
jgi:hypothetical protein